MANFSSNSEFLAVLSCSLLSPSNLRISIIQQSYGLAIASTELCELVCLFLGLTEIFPDFSKNLTFGEFFRIFSIFPSFAPKKGGNWVPRFPYFSDYA